MSKVLTRSHFSIEALPIKPNAGCLTKRCFRSTLGVKLDHSSCRAYAGQAAVAQDEGLDNSPSAHAVQSQRARQKQADREFFADLLSSAATKRDAKAYISRLKTTTKLTGPSNLSGTQHVFPPSKSTVDPNSIFGRSRAVDASPVFPQGTNVDQQPPEELAKLHVALVKIAELDELDDEAVHGIAQTLVQLSRLSMAPVVIIDVRPVDNVQEWRNLAVGHADRLVAAVDAVSENGARRVDDILSFSSEERASLAIPTLLLRPLRRSRIPVILPLAFSETSQQAVRISGDAAVLALTEGFASTQTQKRGDGQLRQSVSLDRVIVIDTSGPIPSTKPAEDTHVFVNIQQEYHSLQEELRSSTDSKVSPRHASNLRMVRRALKMLPPAASGLITTPEEAANSSQAKRGEQTSGVGTRRQKNPLIHNLLTDKPAYSSSLPSGRLGMSSDTASGSTFVKNGMPLTTLPNPAAQEWTAEKQPWIKLTDPRIDLDRLVYLINDSFDRKLDVDAYLERVNDRIAGVIIAGEYDGGAILTWETPPGADPNDSSRLVPYLDKFAVLKTSQGAGGVADILFNAMVRDCFPNGVCWRSRKNNPVNKWYFERSRGTWKIPGMNWTMFWTTPGVAEGGRTFADYEAVCRGVQPTWADHKKVED